MLIVSYICSMGHLLRNGCKIIWLPIFQGCCVSKKWVNACWSDMQRICNKGGTTLAPAFFSQRSCCYFFLSQRFKRVLMSKRGGDGQRALDLQHTEKGKNDNRAVAFIRVCIFLVSVICDHFTEQPLRGGELQGARSLARYPVLVFIVLLLIAIFVFFWYCSSSRRCLYVCAT